MKRTIILIAILISLISGKVFGQFVNMYKNAKHSYSINLPKSMEIEEFPEAGNADTMIAKDKDGSKLICIAKFDNLYAGINSSQLSYKSFMPDLKILFKNVEMKETDNYSIGGQPALYMKVDFKNEDMDGVVSQFILIRSSRIYILRIVTSKEKYEKFSSELAGYIYTFQFLESSNAEFYKNELYNFIIYFPSEWNFDKSVFPVQANNPIGSSIYIEVLKSADYDGMSANDLDEDVMVDALKSRFTNISLAGRKKYIIDGHPVLMLKYKWVQVSGEKNDVVYVIHYYLIKKNLMFIIQGMVSEGRSKNDERLIEQAVQSFQFTK